VISGLLRVSTFYDLPPGYCDDAPIGQGMIAQFLLGPDGWLDGCQSGDVPTLRLHEGTSEIEYRTARGASFATRLSEMRGAAESPEDRSAVMFCEARAVEGRGDSTAAASLVRQVPGLRPGWEPALMDAGEYAMSRGGARAADEYMSRVDHHTARMMRTDMAPLPVPPKSAVSRNQPCPCGSGKKYKQCCLGKEMHPLPDRAKAIYSLLLSYSQRPVFAETLARLVTRADVTEGTAMFCANLESYSELTFHSSWKTLLI
jgi:hypothetical protein